MNEKWRLRVEALRAAARLKWLKFVCVIKDHDPVTGTALVFCRRCGERIGDIR